MRAGEFEVVAPFEDFQEGVPIGLELTSGEEVCLVLVKGEISGIAEYCSHGESPMSDGAMVDDYIIECAMHCGHFAVRDGSPVESSAEESIDSYKVRVVDGYVQVGLYQD